jgi:hypothetical protein
MNTNTLIGAVVAAAILFVSSMVTLFTNDPYLEFDMISTAVWVSIGGGALVAFLKDYQSITTRRFIAKATKSKDGGI